MSPKRLDLDVDYIVKEYVNGMSENALAKSLGVNRWTIRRRLEEAGVHIRNQSEAEALKWSQMSASERAVQVEAAHNAARGRTVTSTELLKRAISKMENGRYDSPLERKLHQWLIDRSFRVIPQEAIGINNCDLGASPVAVEILGGNWHFTPDRRSSKLKALRNLLDSNWHVLYITVDKRRHPLSETVADKLVTYVEHCRRNPTMPREYRMITGTGERIFTRPDSDNLSIEWPFANSRNPGTGRYERTSR